jgi:hypothetical protein
VAYDHTRKRLVDLLSELPVNLVAVLQECVSIYALSSFSITPTFELLIVMDAVVPTLIS